MKNRTTRTTLTTTLSRTLLALACWAGTGPAHASEGQLDKDLIRRIVRAHMPEITKCYEAALVRAPAATGQIVIDFTVGVQGSVTGTEVGSTEIADSELTGCMQTAIKRWLFPRPEGGSVVVHYPFQFTPG